MLRKWLQAGYIDEGKLYPTDMGTPQGGLCSPLLLTVTMSGLENAVKANSSLKDKVNVCTYADDFIITGVSQEVLENKIKPVVEKFLEVDKSQIFPTGCPSKLDILNEKQE